MKYIILYLNNRTQRHGTKFSPSLDHTHIEVATSGASEDAGTVTAEEAASAVPLELHTTRVDTSDASALPHPKSQCSHI